MIVLQIAKRRRGLFPVQPKPPQGFKDYLMNRCTYVLAGTAPTTPNINYPQSLPVQMKDIFTVQEKERYRLRTQVKLFIKLFLSHKILTATLSQVIYLNDNNYSL